METKTKIIATIGPASESEEVLTELIGNGIALARLNFSFGTHEKHKELITKIRKISNELEMAIAIIQDLQGPKLRIKKIFGGTIDLKAGDSMTIVDSLDLEKKMMSVTYPELWKFVTIGARILLNDGLSEFEIDEIEDGKIHCKVVHGGTLVEGKGLNIPSPTLKIPSITDKDRKDLEFGLKNNVDFVALSFVRSPNDVLEIRKIMSKVKAKKQIIAKIEKPEAIENIEGILEVADAIMVARGDLAIEMPLEQVPLLQNKLIELSHLHTKPVIIATQMLHSMEVSPRPTRAEVTDVAHAIHEGTDAVMLSGETAIGKYPVESVQTLVKIIKETEKSIFKIYEVPAEIKSKNKISSSVAHTVCNLGTMLQARAILTFTSSGFTPLATSKQRSLTPIIALTPHEEVERRCSLYWGVKAIVAPDIDSTDKMFAISEEIVRKEKLAKKGDIIIITAGIPFGIQGTTNLIKVHTVGK